jgi:oxygen-independent coproporphyrinogen-3 oxidase
LIRSCGFENVAVDLIYGIPGQTLNGWVKTLNRAVTYNPEHISCYQLTIAEGTPCRQMEQSGGIKLPEELESTALFLTTSELLEESGYLHYEVSNFARAERYLSRHNQKYWRHVSYLGLGPAAHSFHHGARWWNYRSIKQYCQAIEVGYTPVEETENLSEEQLFLEVLYLGLRTRAGLAISQVQKNEHYGTVLSGLVHDQYLEIVNDRVMPTRKGFLVADRLPLALM